VTRSIRFSLRIDLSLPWPLTYSLDVSSILLSVHDNEWYQRIDSDCCGSDHSSIRYDIMMDDHDGECATLENDPLFSDQVDQTIRIDDYGFELGMYAWLLSSPFRFFFFFKEFKR
jgi:hypothetical protein